MKKITFSAIIASLFMCVSCTNQPTATVVEVAYPSQDIIGEGVTWVPSSEKLFWVDIREGVLHELEEKSGTHVQHNFETMVSTVTPYKGDTLLLSLIGKVILYDTKSKTSVKIADLCPEMEGYRPNDGKCSPEGRFWVGMMKIENYDTTGGLYMLDHDLTLKKMLGGQIIPNGIVWNLKGDKMLYIDSARSVVEEYDYDATTGDIKFNRTLVTVSEQPGLPDGMTIDDEDNIWVAIWGGKSVIKYNGKTGEIMEKIEIPALNPATCTFGGENQDVLYINTARDGMSEEQLKEYPLSGSLFKVQLEKGVKRYNHHAFVK